MTYLQTGYYLNPQPPEPDDLIEQAAQFNLNDGWDDFFRDVCLEDGEFLEIISHLAQAKATEGPNRPSPKIGLFLNQMASRAQDLSLQAANPDEQRKRDEESLVASMDFGGAA